MATTEEATPATETITVTTVTVTEPTTTIASPQKNNILVYRVNRKIGMCKTWNLITIVVIHPPPTPPPPVLCPPPSSTIIIFQSHNFQKPCILNVYVSLNTLLP